MLQTDSGCYSISEDGYSDPANRSSSSEISLRPSLWAPNLENDLHSPLAPHAGFTYGEALPVAARRLPAIRPEQAVPAGFWVPANHSAALSGADAPHANHWHD
jgi:hypothetical protein